MRLDEIPAIGEGHTIHVVVESPRGTSAKLKYDRQLGAMTLSRQLPSGLSYPYDWGFVPSTTASDGDPVDALVLSDVGTAPGVVIVCRPLGVLEVEQNRRSGDGRERNDRVIAVPLSAHRYAGVESIFDLPERLRDEIADFFIRAVAFEGKALMVLGWQGPERAFNLIRRERPAAAPAGGR